MNEDRSAWNEELLGAHFALEDLNQILGIPIRKRGCHDRIVWHFTKYGDYTVKFGYKVAMEMMEVGELGKKAKGSNRCGFLESWKKICLKALELSRKQVVEFQESEKVVDEGRSTVNRSTMLVVAGGTRKLQSSSAVMAEVAATREAL
ncbi:hypothetical protein EV1_030093 [Malus domestica]